MRKQKLIAWSTLVLVLWSSSPAGACGDKLLVLGQGARFQVERSDLPAAILLFMNPDVPGSETWGDTQLQAIMKQAGHRLKSVRSRNDLTTALKSETYDIVLADFRDAPGLEELVQTAPSRPVLLPWIYEGTRPNKAAMDKDKSAAKQRYQFILEAPGRVKKVLSIVERTMESKPMLQARLRASAKAKPV